MWLEGVISDKQVQLSEDAEPEMIANWTKDDIKIDCGEEEEGKRRRKMAKKLMMTRRVVTISGSIVVRQKSIELCLRVGACKWVPTEIAQ
jgi:hypothetical protein